MSIQERLESEVQAFRALQKEYTKLVNSRGQFISQQNENEMVKKELDLLDNEAVVYKLIGPVLIKQETAEVKTNVGKRLKFIEGELSRVEKAVKELDRKQEQQQKKIVDLQQAFQTSRISQGAK
mmetsp:Transcript_43994/g.73349  ORF Transcript_43994/g.73349 Transcript_43994/m.73349 type:complete len:124 (-) Transcript_43994:50-421(-)